MLWIEAGMELSLLRPHCSQFTKQTPHSTAPMALGVLHGGRDMELCYFGHCHSAPAFTIMGQLQPGRRKEILWCKQLDGDGSRGCSPTLLHHSQAMQKSSTDPALLCPLVGTVLAWGGNRKRRSVQKDVKLAKKRKRKKKRAQKLNVRQQKGHICTGFALSNRMLSSQ